MGRTWSRLTEDISQRDTYQRAYGNNQRVESQQAVQTPGGKGSQDKGESSHYSSYRRTTEPDREYYDYFRLTRSKPARVAGGFTKLRNQQISYQE
ncbi:hypothetical protein O181_041726 [Austropuccinia psidii MF-1]|uniref:Uncharacterized protein n=1 Tax=Austropuccinia psidii MF-1 TaxID=1389203 RepID=A0A9Q3DK87_9BASI|nr:hypothetical protein [Austropuccinia psidii MF-1]